MIVLLGERVIDMPFDAASGRFGHPRSQHQTGVGRGRMVPECLHPEGQRDEPERSFLAAHPLRPAVRRILLLPVFDVAPENLDMSGVAIDDPRADERENPSEAGKLPDPLDVLRTGIGTARPVRRRVDGAAGEDVLRPARRPTDLDETAGEDAAETSAESLRFRHRRITGGQGP
jgi:hypothetical protein